MALETFLTLSHIRYLLRANMINYAFRNWETPSERAFGADRESGREEERGLLIYVAESKII
jgi:hypothetical protein